MGLSRSLCRFFVNLLIAALLWPVTYYGFLIVSVEVYHFRQWQAVQEFIREHEPIVAERLANPKVHSFRLTATKEAPQFLVIHFDVDDLETFQLLDQDVADWTILPIPPTFDFTIRSKEDPGNDLGMMAAGANIVLQAMLLDWIASILATAVSLVACVLGFRSVRVHAGRAMPA